MEILHIEWGYDSTGSMDILLDVFFPNTLSKAKQLLRLVRRWCPDDTQEELGEYFKEKILNIDAEINEIKKRYPNTRIGSREKKQCETEFKRLQREENKYVKYLTFLNEGR